MSRTPLYNEQVRSFAMLRVQRSDADGVGMEHLQLMQRKRPTNINQGGARSVNVLKTLFLTACRFVILLLFKAFFQSPRSRHSLADLHRCR